MTDETTTEQLAEIEGQAEDTPATEYTPPEGWRVLAVGEVLQAGDLWVNHEGEWLTRRVGGTVNDERYIRRIEPQPEPQPQAEPEPEPPDGWQLVPLGEPLKGGDEYHAGLDRYIRPIEPQPQPETEAQPIQVREGRWRKRSGAEVSVSAMPTDHDDFAAAFPWWDGQETTWTDSGHLLSSGECPADLVEYLGPIEPDKTQELPEYTPPEGWRVLAVGELLQPGDHWVNWEGTVSRPDIQHGDGATVSGGRYIRWVKPQPQLEPHAAAIEELRSEVSYVQRLLGESRQRVTQLEELVASLRTINEAQEKAFEAAGKDNTALRNQLEAAKAELVQERLERNRWHNQVLRVTAELDDKTTQCEILQIELDAAQQVPADSPEMRQLWADLAEVAHDRDTYRHAHELLLNDVNAAHERTKAMTVEAICEWIEPIRREDPHLRAVILFHLPKIMRSLAGLNSPEDVD